MNHFRVCAIILLMETLGEKIVALRKANGLLQSELANEIHVSCSTLCRWEKNQRKPSDADITALANFFGISEKELMPDDKTLSDRRFSVLKPGVMIAIAAANASAKFSILNS